jgi:hypothetical protein
MVSSSTIKDLRRIYIIEINLKRTLPMLYEHHSQSLLSRTAWLRRLAKSLRTAALVLASALLTGILGYHFFGQLPWVDSLLEAAMILAGMGPVAPMHNETVKIFAAFYALISGFIFLASSGIIIAPILHRFLHHFHKTHKNLEEKTGETKH